MKIDSIEMIKNIEKDLGTNSKVLGKGLEMPFNPLNSGTRKQMMGAHVEQRIALMNPEIPRIQTGYESAFGYKSSSLVVSDKEWVVLHKISKFNFNPDVFYYLIVYDPKNNMYDILTRKYCEHFTESYGVLYNNEYMDSLKVGKKISKGDTIRKSLAYDEFNNRRDGVNLMTTYISNEKTKEDGIRISETAAKLLASPLIRKVQIQINDNDIPLNLYGRSIHDYKSFPDIGESTDLADGTLCALRRQNRDEAIYTQSAINLTYPMLSDDEFTAEGTVVDIDVYCNNDELLNGDENTRHNYFSHLRFYHNERLRFMQEFVDKTKDIVENHCNCSYELKKIYYQFNSILNGGQYIKDGKAFSNTMLEITLVEKSVIRVGDKIANRYGGKGVVSVIEPDEMMPLLDTGERVHLQYNSSTCINRENAGQLFEMDLNFISNNIANHVKNLSGNFDLNYTINLYIDYLSIVNPKLAKAAEEYILSGDLDDQADYMSYLYNQGFIISLDPMEDKVNFDTISKLFDRFPFIRQYNIMTPQIGSDGNYRYVKARRTIEAGEQYIWRLKQYAEEKFSAVSLSATNLKNENVRSNIKKSYKAPHAKTCIRFGEMETGNLLHAGTEAVITNLLLMSLAPKARRKLGTELLEGPIFDIDARLDEEASNRSVEILNAYLTAIGLKIVFKKVPKRPKNPLIFDGPIDTGRRPKHLSRPLIYAEDENYYTVPFMGGEQTYEEKQVRKGKSVLLYD